MKTSLNQNTKNTMALTVSTTLAVALLFALPLQVGAKGTDILHFTVSKVMTDTGVESGAAGSVAATQKEQGHADNQTLSMAVTGLSTNTAYELVAAVDSDTNMTDILSFTTDANGAATFNYRNLGNGNGGGKGHSGLPSGLNPVSLIREIDIVNSNAQVVLTADLSAPDKLQYLVKRNLNNGSVDGTLQIIANTQQTQFRLSATGLAPGGDYLLALNDEVVQTNTANSNGRLDIHSLTDTPPFILDVRLVELWDTSSNIVLQAEVP